MGERTLEQIAREALELDSPQAQSAFLDVACAGDTQLRAQAQARLEQLLADATTRGTSVLETPLPMPAASQRHREEQVGVYTLRKLLGRGGFGEVWLADRKDPHLRVAIKFLRPDRVDATSLARFQLEKQALALLNHPGIARIHDSGVLPDGSPYAVMEFVEGQPLTDYCDRNRLAVRQRLDLFAKVCDAVHHAHQQGFIHRDLSPDNILVTMNEGEPTPKIIDFGIAKVANKNLRITEKTLTIDLRTLVGKPEYMAPEQAEAEQIGIDTRADTFSLGVILYELLTGVLPLPREQLRERALDEVLRLVRGERPAPSTRYFTLDDESRTTVGQRRDLGPDELGRLLAGRIRHLPMTALRTDRTKRFTSAAALALDVRNYLDDRDFVEAAAEPWSDKARRHIKRHKLPYGAGLVLLLSLVGGIVGTTWQWRRAEQATTAANERADDLAVADRKEREARELADEKAEEASAALRRIEHNSYVANVQIAGAWLDLREFDRVRERLDACPRQLRAWEWHWLDAMSDNSLAELKGHTSKVISASFSPDGARIVTASYDSTARVWDAATGDPIAELKGHTDPVESASFSPDGARIVTASYDSTARVWDAATGDPIAELKGHTDPVESASFSPDGARIVTASSDNTARVWDAATGDPIAELKGHTDSVLSASFSPDGARIVTASWDNTARVWDAATGDPITELKGHTRLVTSASFSPDGARIVTASSDHTARVWDSVSYRERFMERLSQGPEGAAASSISDSLYDRFGNWTRVADAIRHDPEITDEVRRRALGMITVRAEEDRRAQTGLDQAAGQ